MDAPGYVDNKEAHLKRLRRAEGQVRKLQRMVESHTYCIEVLIQVSAVNRALESFALALLDEQLSHSAARTVLKPPVATPNHNEEGSP